MGGEKHIFPMLIKINITNNEFLSYANYFRASFALFQNSQKKAYHINKKNITFKKLN